MFGHPGTGTTLCLDYFLVRRLAQGFPTFFYDGGLWFFDTNGAMAVDPGDFQIDTYPTSEVWGLINSGTQIPPTLVESSFFLVFAGRPPNIQYNYVDAHHPGSRFHFFQPLSQTELLQDIKAASLTDLERIFARELSFLTSSLIPRKDPYLRLILIKPAITTDEDGQEVVIRDKGGATFVTETIEQRVRQFLDKGEIVSLPQGLQASS
ncbi:hypothetical protein EYR40_006200 [Pleurotus pulmonarius]|nr:hypothetical protein EYR36_010822 [Pleurotus pulmonarius]KAF4599111.1 hypothetical protein EYR40_006200 [Pleurotus pulmonarius]